MCEARQVCAAHNVMAQLSCRQATQVADLQIDNCVFISLSPSIIKSRFIYFAMSFHVFINVNQEEQ